MNKEKTKICNKCKNCHKSLPKTEFYFRKDTNDYRTECKKCTKKSRQGYYQQNKKEINKRCKEYNKKNKEKLKEKKKEYYQKNQEEITERKHQYYLKNKDKISQHDKKYYKKDRDRILKRNERYRFENLEKIKKQQKKRYQENKKEILRKDKIYREKNKEKIRQRKKKYWQKHREKRLAHKKEYYKLNKKMIIEHARIYVINRYHTDINFRLKMRLRWRVWSLLKGKNKSKPTMELLGCDIEAFKKHLEKQFTKEMSWGEVMNGKIHIDHIIPCNTFDLTKPEEQQKCFNFSNLRPLWAKDNISRPKDGSDIN